MHLYCHIPYCASKCPYCDFNSIAGRDDEHHAYVAALLREAEALPPGPYRTVFIGGGTPTMLAPSLLATLLKGLRARIDLSADYEWTCEANPGSADAERFAVLAAHGVNRLSLGVQSTDTDGLAHLGRAHTADEAEAALLLARQHVERVNADLILGLPDQDEGALDRDLDLYRRHDLEHAAVYHLTIEPGTEFHARHRRGELRTIDADRGADLLAHCRKRLAALGLAPYETSNFARPGAECRHNIAYWRSRDYHAIGAGAVSTIDGLRCTRYAHPGRYIAAVTSGSDPIAHHERLDTLDRQRECWMLGLRLSDGVRETDLEALGDDRQRWWSIAETLHSHGLITIAHGRIALSERGRDLQDAITRQLMP